MTDNAHGDYLIRHIEHLSEQQRRELAAEIKLKCSWFAAFLLGEETLLMVHATAHTIIRLHEHFASLEMVQSRGWRSIMEGR